MKKLVSLAIPLLMLLAANACGDDDEDSACDEAFDKWCACPDVTCEGRPSSCSGPDREWAECVLDAEDACQAECL